MPIRMTDDPVEPDEGGGFEGGGGGGRGGGGGGGIFSLLPLIFGLVRGPKSLLLIIALGIGAYFFLGRGGGGCNTAGIVQQVQQLATGGYWTLVSLINQKYTNRFPTTIIKTLCPNLLIFKNLLRLLAIRANRVAA